MKPQNKIELMKVEELVQEINHLAHEQKNRELNAEELTFQKMLRDRYIELYRNNFKENMSSIKVVNEQGIDITPANWKNKK